MACALWQEANELESLGGTLLEDLPPEPMAAESLQQVFARTERPQKRSQLEPVSRLDRGDRSVPRPLRGYLDAPLAELPWRRVGPIGEMQLLPEFPGLTTRLLARLLWIRAGTAVPSHTHQGSELTLVLKGSFADEKARLRRTAMSIIAQSPIVTKIASAWRSPAPRSS